MVSVLASGTQDHGSDFSGARMSQICGMLKAPGNYVEVEFSGEICRPFLAYFRSSLPERFHVALRGAPLGSTGGTKGGAQRAC